MVCKEWTVGEKWVKLTRMKMDSVNKPNKLIYVKLEFLSKGMGGDKSMKYQLVFCSASSFLLWLLLLSVKPLLIELSHLVTSGVPGC